MQELRILCWEMVSEYICEVPILSAFARENSCVGVELQSGIHLLKI